MSSRHLSLVVVSLFVYTLGLLSLPGCGSNPVDTTDNSPTPTPTPTSTPSLTATEDPTPTPVSTLTPTPTPEVNPYETAENSPMVTGKERGFVAPKEVTTLTDKEGNTIPAAKDELLICLKEDSTLEEYNEVLKFLKDNALTVVGEDIKLLMLQVAIPSDRNIFELITNLKGLAGIAGVYLNRADNSFNIQTNSEGYELYLQKGPARLPKYFHSAKGVESKILSFPSPDEAEELWWVNQINLPDAWYISKNIYGIEPGDNVNIGIVDDGFEESYGAFVPGRVDVSVWTSPWLDYDSVPGYHGTWVSAFASANGGDTIQDAVGVAWSADVKVYDVGNNFLNIKKDDSFLFLTHVLAGLKDAVTNSNPYGSTDHKETVVNSSLGTKASSSSSHQEYWDSTFQSLGKLAREDDVLLCFSAGNEETVIDSPLPSHASQETINEFRRNFMLVGASAYSDSENLASFSCRGKAIDIVAPGECVGVGKSMPQSGDGVVVGTFVDGTSFSSPIVAGVSSMIRAINPALLSPEVKQILLDTADSKLFSSEVGGAGFVNAKKAVEIAGGTRSIPERSLNVVTLKKDEITELSFDYTLPKEKAVRMMDVMFLIDVTGSYSDDIATLTEKAKTIMDQISTMAADVQFGVASFADFPTGSYGKSGDKAFQLRQAITSDKNAVTGAIDGLDEPMQDGYDLPESQIEALYQVVTGEGRDVEGDGDFTDAVDVEPSNSGWRTGSLKIVILATDASFHNSENESGYPGRGLTETLNKLKDKAVIVIGIDSGDTGGDLEKVTDATGGQVFDLSYDSAGIAEAIYKGVSDRLERMTLSLKVIGDAWGFSTITSDPSWIDVPAGETRRMKLNLKGVKNSSVFKEQEYIMVIWVQGQNSAILERYPIKIVVPKWKLF